MNHAPTAIRTKPLHRFTACPVIRTGRRASALAFDTTTDAVSSRMANTRVVVVNAQIVWVAPTVTVCAARPASSGPVQPNPASRYPKP